VVTPADQARFAAYDRASVEVVFSAERRDDVLAVPVEALLAAPGGGYGVEVVGAGGATRVVPVVTGMFADGKVEVGAAELVEGAPVVVPS
jgi:multidrug efflux pump subunit AcrA (membrane-fusion protein)